MVAILPQAFQVALTANEGALSGSFSCLPPLCGRCTRFVVNPRPDRRSRDFDLADGTCESEGSERRMRELLDENSSALAVVTMHYGAPRGREYATTVQNRPSAGATAPLMAVEKWLCGQRIVLRAGLRHPFGRLLDC